MNRKIILIGFLTLYGIILFVLLTIPRLPIERMITDRVHASTKGRLAVSMKELDLRFPDRILMKEVQFRVAPAGKSITGRLDTLRMRPDYGGLFRGYLPVRFLGQTPAGAVQGGIGVSMGSGSRDGFARIHTEAFNIEKFPPLQSALDRGVRGVLSGEVEINGDLGSLLKTGGKGRLTIEAGAIEARLGLPGLADIPFDSLDTAFTLEKGVLSITQAEMKGPAFSGSFHGDIRLRNNIRQSRLSLEGELTPGAMVLENAFLSPLLEKVLKGDQGVHVRVRGTLERPTIARSKD